MTKVKHKYLKEKDFDPNMSEEEARIRSFIIAIELFGMRAAWVEYILYASQSDLLDLYELLYQELASQSLFPL